MKAVSDGQQRHNLYLYVFLLHRVDQRSFWKLGSGSYSESIAVVAMVHCDTTRKGTFWTEIQQNYPENRQISALSRTQNPKNV